MSRQQRVAESDVRAGFKDDDSYPAEEVKRGSYYVLGDHRNSSNDSHNWGQVPEKYIYGKAFFRFWPLPSVGFIASPVPVAGRRPSEEST